MAACLLLLMSVSCAPPHLPGSTGPSRLCPELAITPPSFEKELVVALPAAAKDILPAARGRYLLLHFAELRRLGVLDVTAARLVHFIPLPSEDALVAAGAEKILIADPATRSLARYAVGTWQAEQRRTLAADWDIVGLALGCGSPGPALLAWGAGQHSHARIGLVDLDSLEQTELALEEEREPISPMARVWASADGSLFTVKCPGFRALYCVNAFEARVHLARQAEWDGPALPSTSGRFVFGAGRTYSFVFDRLVGQKEAEDSLCVPSCHWPLVVRLPLEREDEGPAQAAIHVESDPWPLLRVPVEMDLEMRRERDWRIRPRQKASGPPLERRVHLIPEAQVLATLRKDRRHLVLRRVDVLAALRDSAQPRLLVLSAPPRKVRPGETWRYGVRVHSCSPEVSYILDSAPPGMSVSREGLITWRVPADAPAGPTSVILRIHDGSGEELYHAFTIYRD